MPGIWPASIAQADFVLTSTKTTGTFNGATKDIWTIQIKNDGTGSTAGTSKLVALDLTLRAFQSSAAANAGTPDGHLYIHTFDQDQGASGLADDADFEALATTGGSFIRFGSATSWTHVSSTPPQYMDCGPVACPPNHPPPRLRRAGKSRTHIDRARATHRPTQPHAARALLGDERSQRRDPE